MHPMDDPAGDDVLRSWRFVWDYPEDPPGGYVFGDMILRADGALLRRYGGGDVQWEAVSWWPGERDPERAARILTARGYDLHSS